MGILQRVDNRINRNPYYRDFKYFLKDTYYYKSTFKHIRTMVLTIGFNRSGSSLVGYLLTAHPNIVIADEIQHMDIEERVNRAGIGYLRGVYKDYLGKLFSTILDIDRLRYQRSISTTILHNEAQQKHRIRRMDNRNERYLLVPNQYQGRFERLKVIGIKSSHENTVALLKARGLVNLIRKLEKRDIKLKFLLTIRNPYDIVARISLVNNNVVEDACLLFEKSSKISEKLLKRVDPQNIFVHRHEDMCKNPRRQLARLCDFLEVPIPAGYIEDCASQVVQKPYKSRADIDWLPQLKQTVARMIEKYDFLSGYDWET